MDGQLTICKACGRPHDQNSATEAARRKAMLERLSESQREVLAYLLMGYTEPQIAIKLHRSRHTVHDHAKAIYAVCGVSRRVHLVRTFQGLPPEDLADGKIPTYFA